MVLIVRNIQKLADFETMGKYQIALFEFLNTKYYSLIISRSGAHFGVFGILIIHNYNISK
jgi:hypothetical protein